MSWATPYIEVLKLGACVSFRPRGNSMVPLINSGDLVGVEPISGTLEKGDIVLCKVNGRHYLHLVKAIGTCRALIGNNHGGINGWTSTIYGKCVMVNDNVR
jgi:SOS-response transcriptional repressor LexA